MSSKFFLGRLLGKGIEFEDYFENMDRINLYVFLSALYEMRLMIIYKVLSLL